MRIEICAQRSADQLFPHVKQLKIANDRPRASFAESVRGRKIVAKILKRLWAIRQGEFGVTVCVPNKDLAIAIQEALALENCRCFYKERDGLLTVLHPYYKDFTYEFPWQSQGEPLWTTDSVQWIFKYGRRA